MSDTSTHKQPDALWYTRCAVPTPLSLAIQSGWIQSEFAPDGITIKSLRESASPADFQSHFDHHLPHSFRQGGSVPAIWARASGQQTRVIGLTWTDEYQSIISLPASRLRSIRDLKGCRIGIPKHDVSIDHHRASALRAFVVALDTVGLSLKDVELVDLPDTPIEANPATGGPDWGQGRHSYVNELYALVKHQVDAIYVKDVRGAEVTHLLGAQVLFDLGFHPDSWVRISNCTPRPLTVNAETIEQYPHIVSRFLRRVVNAGDWAKKHPQETLQLIARETGWAEPWVQRVYGSDVHQQLRLELSAHAIRGLEIFKDFLFEYGFLAQDFNITDWVDHAPLDTLKAPVLSLHR
jgi:ABC-type nitrate/sulfonate/bicarbonate transport system substrate-binding protein